MAECWLSKVFPITNLWDPFPSHFSGTVCLDKDMHLGRYDLSWPYDVHLVTLMVWSKMAEYWRSYGFSHTEHMETFPQLQSFLSTVCLDMDICTQKPALLWLNNNGLSLDMYTHEQHVETFPQPDLMIE